MALGSDRRKAGEYYLVDPGREALKSWPFKLYTTNLADGMQFKVEVIDTWDMTITPVEGVFVTKKDDYHFIDEKQRTVELPGKPNMALRIRGADGMDVSAKRPYRTAAASSPGRSRKLLSHSRA
jgi:5-deoxy-D-glucuronate isomerase